MPLPQWERDARDNDAIEEPTQPAAEHVSPELGSRFYEVTAEAEGDAVVTVRADSEEEAERIAYAEHLCGIDIGHGVASWVITSVREQ